MRPMEGSRYIKFIGGRIIAKFVHDDEPIDHFYGFLNKGSKDAKSMS